MTKTPRGLALFALAAAAVLLWLSQKTSGGVEETVAVERSDLVLTVPIEGVLRPVDSHQLGPPAIRGVWNFRIARMTPEGRDVESGEPVVAFDTSELEKQIVERRAELDSAEREIEKKELEGLMRRRADELRLSEALAKLEKARLKLERPVELVAEKETRALELDRDLAEREVAHLEERRRSLDEAERIEIESLVEQRDRSRSRLRELQESIERMTLTAPRDGTVVYVADRSGEKKRVGESVWRRDKVLAVPDLRRMRAEGFVDESEAGRVALGQGVELRLDAYPEILYHGRIAAVGRTILPVGRNSPLRGLTVEVVLDETDVTRMQPDMRFRGRVEVERIESSLLVPLDAIERSDRGPFVRRPGFAGVELVPVTLGRRNEEKVEVLSGVADGDRIVLRRGVDES
jgi:multidrug efflux pump subunit AcrA (membrane-fusion protein)